ncbi:hypothetical protein DVH24_012480 [Malus domestica]|uniref:Uncharacterized protein n=1 Tax=Malus domestica TaxID=3750 RepID=A0A498HMV5_MALDO|nr:hypothetical protein DVH24_012480 [Malus domestica]
MKESGETRPKILTSFSDCSSGIEFEFIPIFVFVLGFNLNGGVDGALRPDCVDWSISDTIYDIKKKQNTYRLPQIPPCPASHPHHPQPLSSSLRLHPTLSHPPSSLLKIPSSPPEPTSFSHPKTLVVALILQLHHTISPLNSSIAAFDLMNSHIRTPNLSSDMLDLHRLQPFTAALHSIP